MAETTKIEWCDATFSPWVGCSKCSPGCDNCYAERDFDKRRHFAEWGPGKERRLTSETYWKQPLKWNRECREAGIRKTVFCGSLCDIGDPEVSLDWFVRTINLVRKTPNLDWLFLTKRPNVLKKRLEIYYYCRCDYSSFVFPNLWIGTTVCNQEEADIKIPILLETPAIGRFVSIEPILGPVDLRIIERNDGWRIDSLTGIYSRFVPETVDHPADEEIAGGGPKLDWVIAGGETGPKARPIDVQWVRSLQRQCSDASTPYFFKQMGEWDENLNRVGKQKAGCLLHGREYKEFPERLKGAK